MSKILINNNDNRPSNWPLKRTTRAAAPNGRGTKHTRDGGRDLGFGAQRNGRAFEADDDNLGGAAPVWPHILISDHQQQRAKARRSPTADTSNERNSNPNKQPAPANKQALQLKQVPRSAIPTPPISSSTSSDKAKSLAAFEEAQEAKKAAIKLNAELCRNFSLGQQNELGGVFSSPNYPNPYPVNLNCTRLIEGNYCHLFLLFSPTFIRLQ